MQPAWLYPADISPAGKELILLLHGYGSNEADLFALRSYLPERFFPVALRGYYEAPFGGYSWFDIDIFDDGFRADENQMMDSVRRLLDDTRRIQAAFGFSGRTHLLGFSQGSILSYLLMTYAPDLYRLIVAFSGFIYEPLMAPVDEEEVSMLRVFASHGIYDDVIPVEWARKIPAYLRERHIYAEYKEYPAGHYLTEENIRDAMDFLRRNG